MCTAEFPASTASARVSAHEARLVSDAAYGGASTTHQASGHAVAALAAERRACCSAHDPDAATYLAYRNLGMRAAGGAGQRGNSRGQLPAIHPLSKPRDWTPLTRSRDGRSPNLTSEVRLEPESNHLNKDIYGNHFYVERCARLERTSTVIPQLSRNYNVHRPGNLQPIGLARELSHSHSGRPFTLGHNKRYELNTTPTIPVTSALVLNGRNPFTFEKCKLNSRPSVKYPITSTLLNVKDHQKGQSYPDPVVGSSRSFIHRLSELSSLEGETVRQENLKKMRKLKKKPS